MDTKAQLLNQRWRTYFNLAIVFPIMMSILSFGTLLMTILYYMTGNNMVNAFWNSTTWTDTEVVGSVLIGGIIMVVLSMLIAILMLIYLIWFFIASDGLFDLLGIDRTTGNILNVIGVFVIPGVSFLFLPIFFWIKVRNYWIERGQDYNWRALAK